MDINKQERAGSSTLTTSPEHRSSDEDVHSPLPLFPGPTAFTPADRNTEEGSTSEHDNDQLTEPSTSPSSTEDNSEEHQQTEQTISASTSTINPTQRYSSKPPPPALLPLALLEARKSLQKRPLIRPIPIANLTAKWNHEKRLSVRPMPRKTPDEHQYYRPDQRNLGEHLHLQSNPITRFNKGYTNGQLSFQPASTSQIASEPISLQHIPTQRPVAQSWGNGQASHRPPVTSLLGNLRAHNRHPSFQPYTMQSPTQRHAMLRGHSSTNTAPDLAFQNFPNNHQAFRPNQFLGYASQDCLRTNPFIRTVPLRPQPRRRGAGARLLRTDLLHGTGTGAREVYHCAKRPERPKRPLIDPLGEWVPPDWYCFNTTSTISLRHGNRAIVVWNRRSDVLDLSQR